VTEKPVICADASHSQRNRALQFLQKENMATLTLSYKTQYSTTTVEKTFDDDSSFDELYESLREACMALGFSPETVKEYFDWGEYDFPIEDS